MLYSAKEDKNGKKVKPQFLAHTKRHVDLHGPIPYDSDGQPSQSTLKPHSQVLELSPVPPSVSLLAMPDFEPLEPTDVLLRAPILVEPRATIQVTHLKPFLSTFAEAAALVLVLHTLIMYAFLSDLIKDDWLSREQLVRSKQETYRFIPAEDDMASTIKMK